MKPKTIVATVLSVLAVAAAIIHALFPGIAIDHITAVLLAIAVTPWLGLFLRSVKLPGGIKVEYQDLKAVEDKARDVGFIGGKEVGPTKENQAVYERIAVEDPNLALAGLRIELEKELVALGARHGVTATRGPILWIARELTNLQVLPPGANSVLSDLFPLLNKAVHGATVESESVEWALTAGAQILSSLREK